jgi:hypothetical protein
MMRFPARRLAIFALLAVFAFSLAGCWNPFAPDEGDQQEIEPADFRERLTPENVLHNIEQAYIYRVAEEYIDCLSEDFIFFPDERDVQDPELEIPPEWYKIDEANMHENMFDDNSNVESITLTLTLTNLVYYDNPMVEPEFDWCICEVDVDLRLSVFGDLTYLASAPSEYRMRIDIDQVGSEGEDLWEIYEWYDLGDDGRSGSEEPGFESVSLGELKSMFAN